MRTKYQGKEFQATFQAPTSDALNELIESAKGYASENQMNDFQVLEQGPDPDGGYRAIVTAHNWNPISWLKGKLSKKKAPEEETLLLGAGTPPGEGKVEEEVKPEPEDWKKKYEEEKWKWSEDVEAKKLAERRARDAEADASHWRQFGGERGKGETEEEYKRRVGGAYGAGFSYRPGTDPELTEEELAKLSRKQRSQYKKRMAEGKKAKREAEFEIWKEGVPSTVTHYHKVLQKEYWTKKGTEERVPEPRTAEERLMADYHPSEWTFMPVEVKLSPAEQLLAARDLEAKGMEMDILRSKYKQFKRERKPAYRVLKAASGVAPFMAGAVTLGVAGMAKGARPGRGGPDRAVRMHAPGVPLDLYSIRPMLGVMPPSSKDLTGAGLEGLRDLTLPGIRKTKKQVQQVRKQVRREE
jgi:hypothetical protein